MILTNKEPTRADTILNLVIVTSSLNQNCVLLLLPVGGSDNLDQMINLYMVTIADVRHGKIKETQFDLLSGILSSIDWAIAFVVCTDMDGYTAVFVRKLDRALAQSTSHSELVLEKRKFAWTYHRIDTEKERRVAERAGFKSLLNFLDVSFGLLFSCGVLNVNAS